MSPTTIPWQNPAKPRPDASVTSRNRAVAQVPVEPVRPLPRRAEREQACRWRSRGRAGRRRRSRRSPRPSRWRSGSACAGHAGEVDEVDAARFADVGEPEGTGVLREARRRIREREVGRPRRQAVTVAALEHVRPRIRRGRREATADGPGSASQPARTTPSHARDRGRARTRRRTGAAAGPGSRPPAGHRRSAVERGRFMTWGCRAAAWWSNSASRGAARPCRSSACIPP